MTVVVTYPVGMRVVCSSPFFTQWGDVPGTITQTSPTHGLFVPDTEYRTSEGQPIQPWIPWNQLTSESP